MLLPGLDAAPFAIAGEGLRASASWEHPLSFGPDCSEPSPKCGELVSVLIAGRFDGSGSTECVETLWILGQQTSAYPLTTDGQYVPNTRENEARIKMDPTDLETILGNLGINCSGSLCLEWGLPDFHLFSLLVVPPQASFNAFSFYLVLERR